MLLLDSVLSVLPVLSTINIPQLYQEDLLRIIFTEKIALSVKNYVISMHHYIHFVRDYHYIRRCEGGQCQIDSQRQ